mmetsp:Transcript_22018/g.75495  ORF Transcript_22018/g.75495 Transcript_22018/m.75495 type:complete len:145 (+) Transcript_22018:376-810(+)
MRACCPRVVPRCWACARAARQPARVYEPLRLHHMLFSSDLGWSAFLDPRLSQALRRLRAQDVVPAVLADRHTLLHPACRRCVAGHWAAPADLTAGPHFALRDALRGIVSEEADGVYAFSAFSPTFCRMFLEELERFYASGVLQA